MDEPSTGLDPASRKSLWDVVKRAKRKGAIILTSRVIYLLVSIVRLPHIYIIIVLSISFGYMFQHTQWKKLKCYVIVLEYSSMEVCSA